MTKGRRKNMLVLEAQQLPANTVAIATIGGTREHTHHGELPEQLKERRMLDRVQPFELPGGVQSSKRGAVGIPSAHPALKVLETGTKVRGHRSKKRRQCALNELRDTGL